jgi:hypothetical protein
VVLKPLTAVSPVFIQRYALPKIFIMLRRLAERH